MAERVVLQYFIILLAVSGLHTRSAFHDKSLGILSQLLRKDSKSPLIVVVDSASNAQALDNELKLQDDYDIEDKTEYKNEKYEKDNVVRDHYDAFLYNVLRTSDDGNQEDQDRLIAQALRMRCQARVECTAKCSAVSEEKPKKFCQKSCKLVYDDLLKCPPPGNEHKKRTTKKQSDNCQSSSEECTKKPKRGKTCPPSW